MKKLVAIKFSGFQLGHVFSDMEMELWKVDYGNGIEVSIGPRLFRHGNNEMTKDETQNPGVSIGPRLFRHGNRGLRL